MSDYGTLYIIATPIGNLADITLRALEIFKNVETLYAEDTRVTKHLLEHYGIQATLQSLHDFNESKKISSVIEKLQTGVDLGLVSDAGTPLISDPGYKLVSAAKKAGIDKKDVIAMERDGNYLPSSLILEKLSQFFKVSHRKLATLAGAFKDISPEIRSEVSSFAAKSESFSKLTDEEKQTLDEFVKFLRDEGKKNA